MYNKLEPRVHYENPGERDYVIPDVTKPMLTVNPFKAIRGLDEVTILDLGCSHGENPAPTPGAGAEAFGLAPAPAHTHNDVTDCSVATVTD